MFIYKITVVPLNQIYIGLDTKPIYKKSRWKIHCKESQINPKGKLHKAIYEFGVDNCIYEVLESDFVSISKLALAEIKYIKHFDSYKNGLNSTPGGDGLGSDLTKFTDEEVLIIREALGEKWKAYNKKKWGDTTVAQRKEMMKQCHTKEANASRIDTLKNYYQSVPKAKEKHSAGIRQWQKENPEMAKEFRIKNGLKGAEKTSKKVTVIRDTGELEVYNSISEFQRKTGQWMCTIREKSQKGEFYNGYKIKDVE
jgi:group I intron endonuclease